MIVLKATQDRVLSVLQSVSGIVERRHTLPVLANVLIRKTASHLQLTTSDLEIQIRTQEMHRIAESGVASHWLYKSSDISPSDIQKQTHQWLQSLLEMQTESGNAVEFLEHLKVDLFPGEVYVFTPKGKILALPRDPNPYQERLYAEVRRLGTPVRYLGELTPADFGKKIQEGISLWYPAFKK